MFVCDPEGPLPAGSVTSTAEEIAEATVTACASAVASASVDCASGSPPPWLSSLCPL